MSIVVGKARVDLIEKSVPHTEKPTNKHADSDETQHGQITKFRVTTSDDLNFVFGVITWPAADPEVGPVEFIDGLEKYRRLEDAGRANILVHDDLWMLQLRAMKVAGKPYYTLNGVSLDELSEMLGSDAEKLLLDNGVVKIATRAELVGDTAKTRNQLALTCKAGDSEAVAAFYCLTRVIPIMYDFGLPEFSE